ncbi:MAG: HIT domain-containing protein [Candidatus Neomarinimicrobiota bacterium]|nr:MAG: HIT domain-containing protein [Candidatus Neomarinimicrobiota bacterium]
MKKLWAPWRMEYIRAPKEEREGACIFCEKPSRHTDREDLILYRGRTAFILMNLYPYNNAHLMVVPYLHTRTTADLDRDTMGEIMTLADQAMQILRRKLRAEGFNFGANIGAAAGAGIEEHLHFHILPRWVGDTNFMPVIGHTKVLVQGLLETYDELKPEFDQIT